MTAARGFWSHNECAPVPCDVCISEICFLCGVCVCVYVCVCVGVCVGGWQRENGSWVEQ